MRSGSASFSQARRLAGRAIQGTSLVSKGGVWRIGVLEGERPFSLREAGVANPVLGPEHVTDVPAAFVADPFLHAQDGQWLLFFEVMNAVSNKGEIGLARSVDGRSWQYDRIVLREPFHLSYPLVVAEGDHWFMVPESGESDALRIYQAEHFPYAWRHVASPIQGGFFADPTVLRHEGRWYLFVEDSDGRSDRLRLWHSDALTGDWVEHPASPLVDGDPARARPAGRLVREGARLFRLAQDCSAGYGMSVRAFEVTSLTPEQYAERHVGDVLTPSGSGWNATGMHHLDIQHRPGGGWLAAADGRGRRRVRRPGDQWLSGRWR